MSHLMFIAVPGGRTKTGEGLLRVLVVPLLDDGGSLADHAMATWPPEELTSPQARLLVEMAPEPEAATTASLEVRPELSVVPDLWQEFFGSIEVHAPGSPVQRTLDVQPTNAQATEVVGTYREVARLLTSEDERPTFDAAARARAGGLNGMGPLPVPQAGTGSPSDRTVDFHLATSLLREHPAVLRALGLIIDLVVPATVLNGTGAGGGAGTGGSTAVVRVSWPGAPAELPAVQPRWTRFVRPRFLPAPGTASDLHPGGGMVALAREEGGEPVWRLHTIDVDHALRGLAAAGAPPPAATAAPAAPAAPGPADDGLPALRTAGVLLTRDHRELELAGREARQGGSMDDVLTAEQLCLGYRVDARIFGGEWHSLCRRSSVYRVNGTTFAENLLEEGHVKVAGGVDRGDQVLRTDEVVTRWDGWSLAVPRPDLTERPPESTMPTTALPFVLDTTGIRVEPGTLLKLRFGENYQLRARVADVAGGGPLLDEPSLDECDSETVQFRRLEPVLPPDVRVPEGAGVFGPGASAMALVIRTAEGMTDSAADTTRELIAPSATFEVVERHGRLDGPPEASLELLARESLPDPASGGVVGFVRGAPGEPPRDIEPQDWTSSRPGPPPLDAWPDFAPKRVTLRARETDDPTLEWETDELLVVRLGPAEEATLELSSLIDQGATSSFAISNWLHDGGSVSAAEKLFADGRHPMATPAHRISVRHAVRAPRGVPEGHLEVLREEGQTFATLTPEGDVFVGIDAASTLAVDVAASWAPVDDSLDPAVTDRPVGRITVDRADPFLKDLTHEFGDTKHRMVTYTLTAHSRFRDCFPSTDDEALFRTQGSIGPVVVDSSARPVVPVVRSVVPAFVWQEEVNGDVIVRRRLGHRLRVELEAPWFTTGDGEQLAVLCGDATDSARRRRARHAGRSRPAVAARRATSLSPRPRRGGRHHARRGPDGADGAARGVRGGRERVRGRRVPGHLVVRTVGAARRGALPAAQPDRTVDLPRGPHRLRAVAPRPHPDAHPLRGLARRAARGDVAFLAAPEPGGCRRRATRRLPCRRTLGLVHGR